MEEAKAVKINQSCDLQGSLSAIKALTRINFVIKIITYILR